MKNIEKYQNTKDALEAYNQHKSNNVPFDKWLESEYEEPRKPTLLEAVEELKNTLNQKDISLSDVEVVFSRLTAAIEREKRKPVRNFDKYKTPKEAYDDYKKMCKGNICHSCHLHSSGTNCYFAWLYAEAGKEETR